MKKLLRYSFVAALAMMFGNVMADDYELYSGAITEGDYVIYYNGKALKNTVASNRLEYSEVTAGDVISNPDAAIVWKIAKSGDYYTLYNAAVEKYAGATGSKNQAALLAEATDDKALWTITGSETYDFENKARAAATKDSNNKWLRNNGTYGFACYASSTGGALSLYKKADASDNRTATSIEFSGNYATKFTYGANGESCALPSATVKAGETPIDAIVTWEVTKGADFVVGDAEPVIEGNAVKPSNHSYGKLTLKASFAGDTQNKPSSKSYDLTVYKGYMKISEILTDFQKENTKFTSTGIPVSYWCMADETTAGTATVTYVNGSNTYINDGTNDLLLFGSNLGLTKGDVISCDKGNEQGFDGIYGTMKQYSGLLEFAISAADMKFTIKSQGATVTPKTIDVADLGAIANMNAYLKIENAEYVSASDKNLTFKVGEASFIVRQNWTNVSIDGLEATAKYTLEGMGAVYKTSTATTYQLYLTSWTKTGEPTAINEVKANILQNGAVYNVAGQKVNAGYKGLVIKNGKKVVNK